MILSCHHVSMTFNQSLHRKMYILRAFFVVHPLNIAVRSKHPSDLSADFDFLVTGMMVHEFITVLVIIEAINTVLHVVR